ncbi:MAG: hypothetical protein MUE88_03920 [Flavobacteriales bacterium]|nr:hypothetical protein [Flavobacteriales bacterium]
MQGICGEAGQTGDRPGSTEVIGTEHPARAAGAEEKHIAHAGEAVHLGAGETGVHRGPGVGAVGDAPHAAGLPTHEEVSACGDHRPQAAYASDGFSILPGETCIHGEVDPATTPLTSVKGVVVRYEATRAGEPAVLPAGAIIHAAEDRPELGATEEGTLLRGQPPVAAIRDAGVGNGPGVAVVGGTLHRAIICAGEERALMLDDAVDAAGHAQGFPLGCGARTDEEYTGKKKGSDVVKMHGEHS